MEVCGEKAHCRYIGRFSPFETDSRLEKTVEYLAKLGINPSILCCVSFRAKARMNETPGRGKVGVGLATP